MKIVIDTYGSNLIGMGHVIRQIALANDLEKHKHQVLFWVEDFPDGLRKIEEEGFKITTYPSNLDDKHKTTLIVNTLKHFRPRLVILDHPNITEAEIEAFRKMDASLVTFDNRNKSKWKADLAIDSLCQKTFPKPPSSKTKVLKGLDYMVLRKEFDRKLPIKIKKHVKNILITQGGADTWNMIPKIVRAIYSCSENIIFNILIGPAFKHEKDLQAVIKKGERNFIVVRNPNTIDYLKLLGKTDIAISAGGITLFELLSLGIPTIVISKEKKELETVNALEKKVIFVNFGSGDKLLSDKQALGEVINELIKNYGQRLILSRRAKKIINRKGRKRVINAILHLEGKS